jgi:hypothetical protein
MENADFINGLLWRFASILEKIILVFGREQIGSGT